MENKNEDQNENFETKNIQLLTQIALCQEREDFESTLGEYYQNKIVCTDKVNEFFDICCSANVTKQEFLKFSTYLYEFLNAGFVSKTSVDGFVSRKPKANFDFEAKYGPNKHNSIVKLASNPSTSLEVLEFMSKNDPDYISLPALKNMQNQQKQALEYSSKINRTEINSIYKNELYIKRLTESCELASRLLITNDNSREITKTGEFPQESVQALLNPNYSNSIAYIDTQIQQKVEGLKGVEKMFFNKSKLIRAQGILERFSVLNLDYELNKVLDGVSLELIQNFIKSKSTSKSNLKELTTQNSIEIVNVIEPILFKIRNKHKAILDDLLREPTPTTEQILFAQAQEAELNRLKAPEELEQKWFDELLNDISKDIYGYMDKDREKEFFDKLEKFSVDKEQMENFESTINNLLQGNKKLTILLNKNLGPAEQRITPTSKIRGFWRELNLKYKTKQMTSSNYFDNTMALVHKLKYKYQDLLDEIDAKIEKSQNKSESFDFDTQNTKVLLEMEISKVERILENKIFGSIAARRLTYHKS